ncbi:hypothetical protein FPF71_03935 [Algibacter amylolyticus]|uniref:Uncharacterized protein n=1 Tax=Algibacter amylolyticus TaxID=1608400 RepID=A0A5M7BII6_9FLAO|nr:hypothetical protein [Algibacter amylolyticus]KAA5827997.1 hypothetical protein F2B50_03935 [Algibacter amylolyticus]MBB5267239.1 hypothetical protein [Algibacter amylolyticus]TSJ82242.1 hypothetical protein FPF71_03935 [Algibacter amylolyticus]
MAKIQITNYEYKNIQRLTFGKTSVTKWGESKDLYGIAKFLSSKEIDFVNRLPLHVNGGDLSTFDKPSNEE